MKKHKVKKEIIEHLKKTPIVEIACALAGIGRATFYRWKKQDEKFSKLVEEAIAEGTAAVSDLAEGKLISSIKKDNLGAIIFWLKHRHRAFGTKIEIEGTLKHTSEELTEEQKALQILALERALPSNYHEHPKS